MTDSVRVAIARTMGLIAVVGAVGGIASLTALGHTDVLWNDWVLHNGILAVGSGAIAWVVAPSQPRNAEIWVFAWAGTFTGLLCASVAAVAVMLTGDGAGLGESFLELVPAEVSLDVAVVLMFTNFLWVGIFFPLTLGIALFPDGRPLSRAWGPLVWTALVVLVLLGLSLFWQGRPSTTVALGETQDTNGGFGSPAAATVTVTYIAVFMLIPLCVTALIARFRRSSGVERQQFRWVVWGGAVAGLHAVGAVIFDEVLDRVEISRVLAAVALTVLITSLGLAIGRYRLYGVDVVISRTFVYGSLAVFIGGVYVALVVGIGSVLGANDEPNQALAVAATVVVALLFQPLRRRLQRVANRLVYGRRATPYEVLSTFSQRVAAVDASVLGQIARSLAEGTTASAASVWIARGGELHPAAAWPETTDLPDAVPRGVPLPEADRVVDVVHDGERLGALALVTGGAALVPTDERLLAQVASGLGLVMRNLRLTEDLRDRVDELRRSRERIVSVQDETRRTLERDLHDGAQQRLVALKIKLGVTGAMAARAGVEDVAEILDRVRGETDHVIDAIRDFARGIYPPLLEAEGLAAAIASQAHRMPIPVTVHAGGLGRYSRNIESTVYFCVLEALQNVAKYAEATSAHVAIVDDGELTFEVSDDGSGFDVDITPRGAGLLNMADRVDALDGDLHVRSTAGRGTTVEGRIPVLSGVPA